MNKKSNGQRVSNILGAALVGASMAMASAANADKLIWGQAESIQDWDPMINPVGDWIFMYQVFDTLTLKDENLEPQPRLAESWAMSDDGLSVTFNLRDDVTFHDGSKFDSDDVVFTFERLADPDTGAILRSLMNVVESVEAVDQYTVRFDFTQINPAFFDMIDLTPILSSDLDENTVRTEPNGTGPFYLEESRPGNFARLLANRNWWGDGPSLDEILIRILPDGQSATIALETGEIDVYQDVPFQQRAVFAEDPDFSVLAVGLGSLNAHILFNTTVEPFDDARVRRAFHYAVDRTAIVDSYFHGIVEPWCLPWPEASLAFFEDQARGCEQDYARAAELIAEAGFPDGFEADIISRPDSGDTVAQILQQDMLECCNVRLNINSMPHPEAQPLLLGSKFAIFAHQYARAARDPSLLIDGTAIFPNGLWTATPRGNLALYDNPEYAALNSEVRETIDPEERRAKLREWNAFLLDEAAFSITLAPVPRAFVTVAGIDGIRANAEGWPILDKVTIAD